MSMTSQTTGYTTEMRGASTSQSASMRNARSSSTLDVSTEPSAPAASTSQCCKAATTCPPSRTDEDRVYKRPRQISPTSDPLRYSASPTGHGNTMNTTLPRPHSSAIRDMSPPIDRRVPPINSAECCLGIVACDERGEIVGWTT